MAANVGHDLLSTRRAGHVRWNRTAWTLSEEDGRRAVKVRPDKDVLAYHEEDYRLLKDDVFKRAQQRFRAVANDDPR
jgi:hypothetical protein